MLLITHSNICLVEVDQGIFESHLCSLLLELDRTPISHSYKQLINRPRRTQRYNTFMKATSPTSPPNSYPQAIQVTIEHFSRPQAHCSAIFLLSGPTTMQVRQVKGVLRHTLLCKDLPNLLTGISTHTAFYTRSFSLPRRNLA